MSEASQYREAEQKPRPDTSKNGLLKKHELSVKHEEVKSRGKSVLDRLNKKSQTL